MAESPAAGRLRRFVRAFLLLALIFVAAAVLVIRGCMVFGGTPDEGSRARIEASPNWHGDHFENPQPMWNDRYDGVSRLLSTVPDAAPSAPLPVMRPDLSRPPASRLRVTWLGHSTVLLNLDGTRVLIDPVWSDRVSPFSWIGPKRWYPPPIAMDELPPIDAVLISHDHYDHLDMPTIHALAERVPRFIVPLGVGAHLRRWGVAPDRITELDWWQQTRVNADSELEATYSSALDRGPLTITATPARHASGRVDPQLGHTLWSGFAIAGPVHRVWYSGDTGTHDDLDRIGRDLGPFDLSLVEVGQYDRAWPDWHIGPEFAVDASRRVRARRMLPVHWGLFKLANHSWTEPAERVLAAARCQGVDLVLPRPGESIEPATAPSGTRWWSPSAWRDARTSPIAPTRRGERSDLRPQPGCTGG